MPSRWIKKGFVKVDQPPARVWLHARYLVNVNRYQRGEDVGVQRDSTLQVVGREGYAIGPWGRFERPVTAAKVNGEPGGMIMVSGHVWKASEFGLYVTADTHHSPWEDRRCRCWSEQLADPLNDVMDPPPVRQPDGAEAQPASHAGEVWEACGCGDESCGRWRVTRANATWLDDL